MKLHWRKDILCYTQGVASFNKLNINFVQVTHAWTANLKDKNICMREELKANIKFSRLLLAPLRSYHTLRHSISHT